jgi:hypothetical protein
MSNTSICKIIIKPSNIEGLELRILHNGCLIDSKISYELDQHQNIVCCYDLPLDLKNQFEIQCISLKENENIKLSELVIDGIRFGIVLFFCTTTNGTLETQLNSPGSIMVEFDSPVWKFWCKKMNEFNYERYPLGSVN